MKNLDHILAKGEENGRVTLVQHLSEVALLAEKVAQHLGLETSIARKGAILHDIGKASSLFQNTLKKNFQRPPGFLFRHELASLFFISILNEEEKHPVIDMIVAHHKSIYKDAGGKGLLDLDENEPEVFEKHIKGFDIWSKDALSILENLKIETKPITVDQAKKSFYEVVDYCQSKKYGYSQWKGVLIAADHLASAMSGYIKPLERSFLLSLI